MTTLSKRFSAEVYKEILTRRETVGARPVINQVCIHTRILYTPKSKQKSKKQKEERKAKREAIKRDVKSKRRSKKQKEKQKEK